MVSRWRRLLAWLFNDDPWPTTAPREPSVEPTHGFRVVRGPGVATTKPDRVILRYSDPKREPFTIKTPSGETWQYVSPDWVVETPKKIGASTPLVTPEAIES